ncbi:MAG TPA: NAD(P)/FAD-dependent oxidoreductase [Bacillota bacterium]|nr:NAD(P)/FAD-dependent oxidoreductase [Bacillota bacterium]
MEQFDFAVIGAGVVGLAVAVELAQRFPGQSLVLLERHPKFGQETSSRNSEVIHSGIYYPTGSLKAQFCVSGKELLYEFCNRYQIPHQKITKLIIARNNEEIPALEGLMRQGALNGVLDLKLLDQDEVRKMEPAIHAVAAIISPSTGVIDSHRLMACLETLLKQTEAIIAYGYEVTGLQKQSQTYTVTCGAITGDADQFGCRYLINCAGLASDKVATLLGIDPDQAAYRLFPCKGEYFSVKNSKAGVVSRLIYPPPLKELKGLGIHLTKSLDGQIRLGPNAFYVDDSADFNVNPEHAVAFFEATRSYLPFLEFSDLEPDTAGIRPKLQGPGAPFRDFVVAHEAEKSLPGVINLIGIESPGLTSCLALAKHVGDLVEEME